VLVGHLTFSCLGFIPNWLNEGLAMYGEGGLQSGQQAQLDQAKTAGQLPSLRSLAGGFSETSDRANLSYAESYSVVNYLINTYGRDKMTSFLLALRDGASTDAALHSAFGFDTDGLEDAWRTSINATARVGTANPTPVPTATQVPTFVPVGAVPVAQANPTQPPAVVAPTSTPAAAFQTSVPAATAVPFAQQLGLITAVLTGLGVGLIGCLLLVLLIAILIIILSRRNARRQK
jgi:hypothetical protein